LTSKRFDAKASRRQLYKTAKEKPARVRIVERRAHR